MLSIKRCDGLKEPKADGSCPPNCVFHVYKIETFGETHITQTGPHCGDPNATPPVAIPQPGTRSRLKSKTTRKDGTEEVVIELPDGTTVTITTPPGVRPVPQFSSNGT